MSQLLKITTLLHGLLLFFIPAPGQTGPPQKTHFRLSLAALQSTESFRWSIAGNEQGTGPNILSELRFAALKRTGFRVEGRYRLNRYLDLSAAAGRQYGYSGGVTDVDYAADNRSRPTSYLRLQSKKNPTSCYRFQLHYRIAHTRSVSVSAGGGYAISKARYRMQDRSPASVKGLYDAQWQGPEFCLEGWVQLMQSWRLLAGLGGRYNKYKAQADWIYRSDFSHPLSFVHQAKGWGMNGSLGLNYQLTTRFGLHLGGSMQQWETGPGSDLLFMANGQITPTRMNESVKTQLCIDLGGVFDFW